MCQLRIEMFVKITWTLAVAILKSVIMILGCNDLEAARINMHNSEETSHTDSEDLDMEELNETKSDQAPDIMHPEVRLQEEVKEFKDRYMRLMADMENLRKRTEREKADIQKYAIENIVKDLVPFLDSFEKASEQTDVKNPNEQDGLGMIYKQFMSTLNKHGLEVIACAGAPFNPNFHQAIQKTESADVKVDTVQTEFAKGFLLNGRLIRPAIVSVVVPVTSSQAHTF